jgi:biopolymer transport protein ExbD
MAAEVGGDSGGKKGGKKGRKKAKMPRIDMTPLVDLGFLLLTFFILTTTMSTPTTMPVVVPPKIKENQKDQVDPPKIQESRLMTILLGKNDRVYYYIGSGQDEKKPPEMQLTGFSKSGKGIREAIIKQIKAVRENPLIAEKDKNIMILIKPMDDSKYKNMVDILDEMNILQQKNYALISPSPVELEMVKKYNEQANIEN